MDIKSLLNTTDNTEKKRKTAKKLHTCNWEECSKQFSRPFDLKRHTKTHTGEKPFCCSRQNCKKRFIQRSALNIHLRTHTGEKPHKCLYEGCRKLFGDSSSLARHRKIHTSGNKSHACSHCSKTFASKGSLKRHQNKSHVQPNSSLIFYYNILTMSTPTVTSSSLVSTY